LLLTNLKISNIKDIHIFGKDMKFKKLFKI
jgi:hypothetical protein